MQPVLVRVLARATALPLLLAGQIASAALSNFEVTVDAVGVNNAATPVAFVRVTPLPANQVVSPAEAPGNSNLTGFTANRAFTIPTSARREMMAIALAAKTNNMTLIIRADPVLAGSPQIINMFIRRPAP